jgi:Spy/CpxP family protein refolding chaperone
MRRALPWILLAISLALNAFFVGGHLYARHTAHAHTPHDAAAALPPGIERLELSPEQRQALLKLRVEARERVKQSRPVDREVGLALLDELMKPQRQAAATDALARQLNDRRYAYVRPMLDDLAAFLATLRPEQRAQVRALAEQRGPMFLIMPDMRKRPPQG